MRNEKKQINNWLFTLVITAGVVFAPALHASSYVETKGHHSVRIRTSPNGRVIGSLSPGGKIAVVGNSSHRGWLQVRYQGRTAWIFKPLVNPSGQRRAREVQSGKVEGLVELRAASAEAAAPEPAQSKPIPLPPTRPVSIKPISEHVVAAATAPVAEPDNGTAAGYCEKCNRESQNPIAKIGEAASGVASAAGNVVQGAGNAIVGAASTGAEKVKSWFASAWDSANKPRRMARFCGGGVRSGNQSKCMCAQAAKEALVKSGICNGPMPGNAIDLHRDDVIIKQCPALKYAEEITDPRMAPVPSLTIYEGYAGKRRHSFGHVEAKIMRDGKILYCSDFCRPYPTMSEHNHVAGIYTLK